MNSQVMGTDTHLHVTCTEQSEKVTSRKARAVEKLRLQFDISKGGFGFVF